MATTKYSNLTGIPVVQPVITPPTLVTMTSSWNSNTTITAWETQEGEWADYYVKVALTGTPPGGIFTLTLPAGRTINTNILQTNAEGGSRIPGATVGINDTGVQGYEGTLFYSSSTTVAGAVYNAGNTYVQMTGMSSTVPFNFGSGDYLVINFRVPILEWAGQAYVAYGAGAATATVPGLVKPRKGQTALTVTCPQAGFSVIRAQGIYYQDQDGNHRLKFNLAAGITSASISSLTLTVSGVTFKNLTNWNQACTAAYFGVLTTVQALTNPNASTISVSSSAVTATGVIVSGDVELESKPSWA